MSTLLAIKAHPLSAAEATSILVFDRFLETYQESHPQDTIEVLDLYNSNLPEIDYDIASAQYAMRKGTKFSELTALQQEKMTRFNQYTVQFLAADKLVIANPLWNLNVPSKLKAWFDTACVTGKSFKYTANGPVGLATGKRALHIQSSGGFYNGKDLSSQYVKGTLEFLGINEVDQLFIEGIDHYPEKAAETIQNAIDQAQTIAKNF